MATNQILEHLNEPRELEALFRRDPDAFRQSLQNAVREKPGSPVLQVWQARFEYDQRDGDTVWRDKLFYALGIALLFGALVRVPALWLTDEWYYPRLAPSVVMLALSAYFWIAQRDLKLLAAGAVLTVVSVVHVNVLPDNGDSVVMALIHLPIVFWILLGVVFTGDRWRETDARIEFVRYNGELVVLGSLVALGGMVFSAVTIGLFELIAENVEEPYFANVGVFGAVAVPVAGTFLYDAVFNRRTAIAAVLARIFAPLFLVMTVTYLIVAFVSGQNPFMDRSFLITFNGLLLLVLGITVFSIVERGENSLVGLMDYVNLALAIVTLFINVIALSAILFRLASYGFTPNRVVVLGANLIIMLHLTWMCWAYVQVVRRREGFGAMRRVVASYLPVYGAWAGVVVFVLPFVFGFA